MNALLNLHFDVRGDLLEAARECEEDVFLEAFGNTRTQLDEEYGPYNDQSVFIAVSDENGAVLGAARLITPGAAGLKTLNDIGREPWLVDGRRSASAVELDVDRTWDIATIGVRRELRGSNPLITAAMYHAILAASRVNDVVDAVAILDDHARRVLASVGYIYPVLPGTETRPYLGSPASTPCYAHIAGCVDAQRRINPDAHRLITLGIGLDGISIPSTQDFVVKPRLVPAGAEAAAEQGAVVAA